MRFDNPKRDEQTRDRAGVTILEVILILAIISIIAVIAIPVMGQARITANETSAISSLRALRDSNVQYRVRFGVYASTMDDLFNTGYITANLADPIKSGYGLSYAPAGQDFSASADPADPGDSGNRHFYVDASGIIRFSTAGPATNSDNPI